MALFRRARCCSGRPVPVQHRSVSAPSEHPDPLESEARMVLARVAHRPELAVALLDALPADSRKRVDLQLAVHALEEEFRKADINQDGRLSMAEFKQWAHELARRDHDLRRPATRTQLVQHALRSSLPFVAFGMVDNGLMVLSGEAIDSTLGAVLGISTMAAAGIGNALSNGVGMCAHGAIERGVGRLGVPDPQLTLAQSRGKVAQRIKLMGSVVGVVGGCLIGMLPLAFK